MAETKTQAQEPKKSGSNKGLLIAFIIILLVINGVQLFLNLTKTNTIKEQTSTISSNKIKIDSMTVQLDNLKKELEAKLQEIASLSGDTTILHKQILELEKAKRSLQYSSSNWQKKYNDAIAIRDAAVRVREDSDKEIDRLKLLLAQQDTIITKQKFTIVEREDTIAKITKEKKKLEHKVALASVLRAENFKVEVLNAKGKVDADGPFKAKRIDKVRVDFWIGENLVAEKGGRDVYFRLIEPDGSALFDLANGGGSFQADGKEVFYTMKQTILFENRGQNIKYEYKKGTPYKPGTYKIEIYCEGFKIGGASFVVK
jgi:hypothetical protein